MTWVEIHGKDDFMHRLLLSLVILAGCSNVPTEVETVEHLNSTSALVSNRFGHGSGFVVSDWYLVTCHHVAGKIGSVVVLDFDDGVRTTGIVVAQSKSFDVDVIRMKTPRYFHVRLRVAAPDKGEPVYWVGNPFGFYFLAAKGLVGGFSHGDPRMGGIGTVLINGQFMPGYSGSGIGDSYGRIIGMVDMVYVTNGIDLMPIGMAVPTERIAWLLRINHIPYHE